MSIHTGQIGTPPRKSRLHIENNTVLALLIVLVVALVFVWLIGLTMQYMNVNTTAPMPTGQQALHDQRAGEWTVGIPSAVIESQALHDQRAGEWAAGVMPMVMGSRTLYDQRVGEWSVGVPAFLFGQSALHEQRVGEWNTGSIASQRAPRDYGSQPHGPNYVNPPQQPMNTEWQNRMTQARVNGIR